MVGKKLKIVESILVNPFKFISFLGEIWIWNKCIWKIIFLSQSSISISYFHQLFKYVDWFSFRNFCKFLQRTLSFTQENILNFRIFFQNILSTPILMMYWLNKFCCQKFKRIKKVREYFNRNQKSKNILNRNQIIFYRNMDKFQLFSEKYISIK